MYVIFSEAIFHFQELFNVSANGMLCPHFFFYLYKDHSISGSRMFQA